MTLRPIQLHVMLAPEELSALRALADGLGMNVSTTIRTLIKSADADAFSEMLRLHRGLSALRRVKAVFW